MNWLIYETWNNVILLLEGLIHDLYKDLWTDASKTNQSLRFADVRLYTDGEIFVECKLGQSFFSGANLLINTKI